MYKLNERERFLVLVLGMSLGIVSFFFFLCKSTNPNFGLNLDELLIVLLSLFLFFGGNIGFSFHFCEVNKGKFSAARLDLKLIVIFFLVLYFFVVVALVLSSFWITFPKASYYSYSALSLAGGLLLGSLIDFVGRKVIGIARKHNEIKEEN